RMVMNSGSRTDAAIASVSAAAYYGAQVLAEGIEDNSQNFTRFLLLTRTDLAGGLVATAGIAPRKTSIVFRVANTPGALYKALAAFALRAVDLCKIDPSPMGGRQWDSFFYRDFAGDRRAPPVDRAIAHLAEMAESIRVLGSYPSASY